MRGWAPLRGVVAGREKYIDLPIAELYNLARDPRELDNLALTSRDRAGVLTNVLRGYNTAAPSRPGQESADVAAKLKSIGYLTGSAPQKASYTEADDPKKLVDIDRNLHTATEQFQQGRLGDAIALFNKVIALRADTVDAYIQLAYACTRSGQAEQAIATLEAGAEERRAEPGHPHPAGAVSRGNEVDPEEPSSCSRALPRRTSKP